MSRKQFIKLLNRDTGCLCCGRLDDTLTVQHRGNRGMGGYKAGNNPANLIVLCSWMNGQIESDADAAQKARQYGWKISKHDDPTQIPVFSTIAHRWFLLDSDFGRKVTTPRKGEK